MAIAEAPMPVRYDKLIPALKVLLPDDALDLLGRSVSFIRRLREIHASVFVWSVVLSRFGVGRPAFEHARQWYRRLGGRELWPRPFQMRFKSPAAVRLFEGAFERAVRRWRAPTRSRHPLARQFPDIAVIDSTLLQLADHLRPVFKGTISAKSSLKALLSISVFGLLPLHARVVAGSQHDMVLFPELNIFRTGTLLLFDKGFVAYERLAQIASKSLHFLCPMRLNGNAMIIRIRKAPKHVRDALRRSPDGVRLRDVLPATKRIGKAWDLEVRVRSSAANGNSPIESECRLVIVPGPERAQRPYLTTLSPITWSPSALAELYRLRWQVELVFKELKQHLNLDCLPSKDPHAVQVFVWASLLALALSRTVTMWLCPPTNLVGLTPLLRPALVSRALRGTIRLLARALVEARQTVRDYLQLFAEELWVEIRVRDRDREDSFKRIIPMLRPA
jgi:hypothetical protein